MSQRTGPCNAKLIQRIDLTDELAIGRVALDAGPAPAFEPGQFVDLGLPVPVGELTEVQRQRAASRGRLPMVRRAYSIASSAHERGYLEFYITLIEHGKLTPRLWSLAQGEALFMSPAAKGEFTLESVPHDADVVMIATGTGLGPFMSMLRTYAGKDRWRRVVLIHAVRQVSDLGYRDELASLSARDGSIHYLPTVTRADDASDWAGLRGRPQVLLADDRLKELAGIDLDPATCHVMLCGNPRMVEQVQAMLIPRGFIGTTDDGPGNLHFEQYW